MIDLTDENDPLLFAVTLPSGRLIFQVTEVAAALHEEITPGSEPTHKQLVDAIRRVARTPEIASAATDQQLISAFSRAALAVESSGKS